MVAPLPSVSVIVPCFNQARFLPDAIRSIQAQTCEDWECLIINDGSIDATREVGESFTRLDRRIRIVNQANHGLAGARNRGLVEARGQFVQFLDADDAIRPTKLDLQIRATRSGSRLSVAYCDYYIAEEGDLNAEFSRYYLSPKLDSANPVRDLALRWESELSIPCHCFLFDSRIFGEHGIRFDERLPNHEDWDCWMRIFALPSVPYYQDAKLAIYRFHGSSLSRDRLKMRRGFLRAIAKQRRHFRRDPKMAAILGAKYLEVKSAYIDQALYPRLTRGIRNSWLSGRGALAAAVRAISPDMIERLKGRRSRRSKSQR